MPKAGKNNCGCNCSNASEYSPCGYEVTCCESCPDGMPCGWALLFGCYGECNGLKWQPITVLWKECLFDCEWTSRAWPQGDGYNLPSFGGRPCDDLCGDVADEYGWVQYFPPVWGKNGGLAGFPTEMEFKKLDFTCCKAVDPLSGLFESQGYCGRGASNGDCDPLPTDSCVRCGWRDYYRLEHAYGVSSSDCGGLVNLVERHNAYLDQSRIMWRATSNSSTSFIVNGYTDDYYATQEEGYSGTSDGTEFIVTYETSNFNCDDERVTLIRTDENDICPALPDKVCLAKYSSNWKTYCGTTEQACNCKDPGWAAGKTTIVTDVCDSLNGEVVCMIRVYTWSVAPCTGISAPETAPCGFFYGAVTSLCGHTLWVVTWCDGSENGWHTQLYCEDDSTGECTQVCDTDNTVLEFCPDGAILRFTCDDFGDCCCDTPEPIPSDCCEDGFPATMYFTFSAPSCAALDGQVVELTWNRDYDSGGGNICHEWSGSVSAGGCSGLSLTMTICDGCLWFLDVKNGGSACLSISQAVPPAGCPLVSETFTAGTWDSVSCPCCGGVSVGGTLSP